jgi:hypothetical protein
MGSEAFHLTGLLSLPIDVSSYMVEIDNLRSGSPRVDLDVWVSKGYALGSRRLSNP